MDINGFKLLELPEMAGIMQKKWLKWLELRKIAEPFWYGWKQLAGNSLKWLEISENNLTGCTWL